ncbi:MAG: helix-turn-helix transcriptional regulator [Planctomycetes bacterium]|nr:helix-turn-helix transcriptional regulator [Planctomycetota bacterium]
MVEQLREAIRKSGESLNHLGERSGVARSTLSRFMRGKQDLGLYAAEKICTALGLRLAGGEGTSETPAGSVAGRSAGGPAIDPSGQKKPATGQPRGKGGKKK